MPDGFEKQVSRKDLTDLLEFLTPARQVCAPAAEQGRHRGQHARAVLPVKTTPVERLIFPDWDPRTFEGVPFNLTDPQGGRVPNVVMLHSSQGTFPPKMPSR